MIAVSSPPLPIAPPVESGTLAPADLMLWHHACEVAARPAYLVPGRVEVWERCVAPGTDEHHDHHFAFQLAPDTRGRLTACRMHFPGENALPPSAPLGAEACRLLDRLAASLPSDVFLHATAARRLQRLSRTEAQGRRFLVLAGARLVPGIDLEFRVWIDRDRGLAHRMLFQGRVQRTANEPLAAAAVLGAVRYRNTPDGHWHPVSECLRASFWSSDLTLPPRGTAERITHYARHWLPTDAR